MAADLIAKARAGDARAFQELTEPHRRELRVHCYRMLGSFQEAEDVLQETFLAAWQGFAGFEGRASLRNWLYTVATHRCINARRAAHRRPAQAYDVPGVQPPEPTRLGEVSWLEPFPDALLEGALEASFGADVRYEQTEAISLAFVTALQALPPRQLAVLVLCDVLGFEAREVGEMLESSIHSVNSALKRARTHMQGRPLSVKSRIPRPAPPLPRSPAEDAIAAEFVRAWESADLDALVALLTKDVFVSMPPIANEYQGRERAAQFFASIFDAGRRFELVPTRANRQPAFGAYLRSPSGVRPGVGLYVLALGGGRISALTRFEPEVLGAFGLPPSLPPA